MLFAGLWTLADREGRLEDRPLRIKAELFPYDDALDIDGACTVLARCGFIRRYEVAGRRYIDIPNFLQHQSPHKAEQPSKIPAYNPKTQCTVDAPDMHQTCTEVAALIPDSLIPDSLDAAHARARDIAPTNRTEFDQWAYSVLSAWNETMHGTALDLVATDINQLPTPLRLQLERCSGDELFRTRFPDAFAMTARSGFLTGKRKKFKCDISWVLKNYDQILTGKYDDDEKRDTQNSNPRRRDFIPDADTHAAKRRAAGLID